MRYYCKGCETEILLKGKEVSIYNNGTLTNPEKYFDGLCPICDEEMEKISDYETPDSFKKRTGEAYPEKGMVWNRVNPQGAWFESTYEKAKNRTAEGKYLGCNFIVIANPPTPPPDNWRPENAV
jgi:hypothetical protein